MQPDPTDVTTVAAGAIKRLAPVLPKPDPVLLERYRAFVRRFIRSNFTPLSPDTDLTLEHWLDGTNYPEWRKQELREAYEAKPSFRDLEEKDFHCKSFIKDETYPDWKHARWINSRTDYFKVHVGPIFKAIEHEVYRHPSFIKHVPVKDRPEYIMGYIDRAGFRTLASDFTSFESQHVREIMLAGEVELYLYMTQHLPKGPRDEFRWLVDKVIAGEQVMVNKFLTLVLAAIRASGDMNTSLGNGFMNLTVNLFAFEESGCREARAVVEGDDGLFSFQGPRVDSTIYSRLGLDIKLEEHEDISSASFCGIVFDPTDGINVTDVREALVSFGWTTRKYLGASARTRLALLRCVALSYAHQYPGCPIISALARYGLRVTRSVDVRRIIYGRNISGWERDQLLAALKDKIPHRETGMATRLLVERLYGVSVEHQLSIEAYLDSLQELTELSHPAFELILPEKWADNWTKYVRSFRGNGFEPALDVVRDPALVPEWDGSLPDRKSVV